MSPRYRIVSTPLGHCGFVAGDAGVRRVQLPQSSRADTVAALCSGQPDATEDPSLLPDFAAALQRYFAGEPVAFDVSLALDDATPFEREIWQACRQVPYGMTVTYAELAARAGHPNAARAVGAAMARNRCPLVIPCHRVLRSDGALGGFSGPGGVSLKRELLDLEAHAVAVGT